MIGYDVDIWIVLQTLMRANLSVIERPLDGSVMREQFDGPKASIDRPWSVLSLLLGLGHRRRYPYQDTRTDEEWLLTTIRIRTR